jgi:hypothetical protein
MSHRLAAAAFGSFFAVAIAVAGCSSGGTGSSGTGSSGGSGSSASAAATAVATGQAATSPATAAAAPGSRSSGSGHGLTVTITGLSGRPALTLGGAPLQFTVNIRNTTKRKYRDVAPVVAIARCTCTSSQAAPAGTLQEFSLVTGKWRTLTYDTVDTTDYLNVVQQSPLTLNPGGIASFTFRIEFGDSAQQSSSVNAGQTALVATLVQHPSDGSAGPLLATTKVGVSVSS